MAICYTPETGLVSLFFLFCARTLETRAVKKVKLPSRLYFKTVFGAIGTRLALRRILSFYIYFFTLCLYRFFFLVVIPDLIRPLLSMFPRDEDEKIPRPQQPVPSFVLLFCFDEREG